MFELDTKINLDTMLIEQLKLSQLRLMRDSRWPWLLLVPKREGVSEIYELNDSERVDLMREICATSRILQTLCNPDKINVGALGNIVQQLHIHVIARRFNDPGWPGPVWGHGEARQYAETDLAQFAGKVRDKIQNYGDIKQTYQDS